MTDREPTLAEQIAFLIYSGGDMSTDEKASMFDAILASLRRLQAIEQSDGWIKCSERLPKDGVLVLVSGPSGCSGHTQFVCEAYHDSDWHPLSEQHWYDAQNEPLSDSGRYVTHWRPLPPLPRSE